MSVVDAAFFVFAGFEEDSRGGSFCPIHTELIENRPFCQKPDKHNILQVLSLLVAICCDKLILLKSM